MNLDTAPDTAPAIPESSAEDLCDEDEDDEDDEDRTRDRDDVDRVVVCRPPPPIAARAQLGKALVSLYRANCNVPYRPVPERRAEEGSNAAVERRTSNVAQFFF